MVPDTRWFARMFIVSTRLALGFVLALLGLDGRAAHAQSAPLRYWTPGWSMGLGGGAAADQNPDTYGNFPSFDFGERSGGFSYARYNFPNGWFVGSQRGVTGLNGFSQSNFGSFGSVDRQGVQFGYSLKDSGLPVSFYGGVDTLKYNTGIGNPFSQFDTTSGTLSGYNAQVGIEIQPTPNLSLSLGVGYVQQPGGINAPLLPGASPFGIRR
jgi:hypothetical protein